MENKYREPLNKMTTQERCRYMASLLRRANLDKPGTYEHDQIMIFEEAAEKIDNLQQLLGNVSHLGDLGVMR